MVYALKDKKYFQFSCISKTEAEMEDKIETSYCSWRACKSRSAPEETKRKDVFLADYMKVKITIEKLK
jgi:hypothetical protein